MQVHFLAAPIVIFIWMVTHPSTNRAQNCLTLMIKWVVVCTTLQDAVLHRGSLGQQSEIFPTKTSVRAVVAQ
jgi:hypothetical protein